MESLFHEVEEHLPDKKSIAARAAPYKRQSLLLDATFLTILDRLTWH